MDIRRILSVNNEEKSNNNDNIDDNECEKKIFEAYFFILLEYINKNRKFEIKMNDILYSDNCILIPRSVETFLKKRFQLYCKKINIDYKSMNHIIPVEAAYSVMSIITVLNNYLNLGKSFYTKPFSQSDIMKHFRPVSATVLNPPPQISTENVMCFNPRHYLSSVTSKTCATDLSALLTEKNTSLRPPTLTPDGKLLNDLSNVDNELLKAVVNASEQLTNKSITNNSNSNCIKMDKSIVCEWGTVMYYELNSRVGDAFASATPIMTIDGYTSPSINNSRFSLGHLTNVSRNSKIEETRKFIGKGAKFYYIKGELFLECLSDNAIFVQSPMSNIMSGWHPATVIKIPPKCNIKVFSEKDFKRILHQHELRGFEAAFSLTPLCSIRISFVKGWGASYSRQTITTTPCWVEVHLNQPLKCLDATLRKLETPSNPCSSRS